MLARQLKAELALAKQVRANLLTQGQSLEQVSKMNLNTTVKPNPQGIAKQLEGLLART